MTKEFKPTRGDVLERSRNGILLTLATCCLSVWDIVTDAMFDSHGATPKRSIRSNDTMQYISDYAPKSYRPVGTGEFRAMIEKGLEGNEAQLVTAGTSGGRRKMFAAYRFTEAPAFTAGGRVFEPYLSFLNSLDGSTNVTAVTGNRCGACDNQWDFISRSKGKLVSLRVRHTINSAPKIENISEVVKSMIAVQTEFARVFDGFHAIKITATEARDIFTGFYAPGAGAIDALSTKTGNKIEELLELFANESRGNKGETLADAFSAITDLETHGAAESEKDPLKQFESSSFGTGAKRKADAYETFQDAAALLKLERRGADWYAQAVQAS